MNSPAHGRSEGEAGRAARLDGALAHDEHLGELGVVQGAQTRAPARKHLGQTHLPAAAKSRSFMVFLDQTSATLRAVSSGERASTEIAHAVVPLTSRGDVFGMRGDGAVAPSVTGAKTAARATSTATAFRRRELAILRLWREVNGASRRLVLGAWLSTFSMQNEVTPRHVMNSRHYPKYSRRDVSDEQAQQALLDTRFASVVSSLSSGEARRAAPSAILSARRPLVKQQCVKHATAAWQSC